MQTFKKCDMHVHSSSCESRSYSYEEFEKTLLESDLDVIAITDHNSVDVELIQRLAKKLSLEQKTLIAGVELNVKIDEKTIKENKLVIPSQTEYFHGIVWCDASDVNPLQKSVYRLLERIDINSQRRKDKSAKEISALSKGKAFYLSDIQEELKGLKYFFTFHESKGDNKRNLSGYLKNGVGGNEEFKHSLFYYNQRLAIEGGKKSKFISDYFETDLNTTVCRFFCSDAKTLAKIGKFYTWIDFDGDIDSLNLAITDPQSRIVTSDESSDIPQLNLNDYLEAVRFNLLDSKGGSSQCEIEFVPSYNGIVGSRGSGKSMLARILAGKIDDGYEKHVDPNSVYYRLRGGQYSKNLPRCLFLSQGELRSVFDDADYTSVPFLEQRLKQMKDLAKEASDSHYEKAKDQLRLQVKLISKFKDKYAGCLKRPDALQSGKSREFSLKIPPNIASDSEKINNSQKQLASLIEELKPFRQKVLDIKIESSFTEAEGFTSAFNKKLTSALTHFDSVMVELSETMVAYNLLQSEPFESRGILLKTFIDEVERINKEKSLSAHNYERNIKEANEFLDDLLALRIDLNNGDQIIEHSVKSMLNPIPIKSYQTGEDDVTISLTILEEHSYLDSVQSQFKAAVDGSTAIIKFILSCSDVSKAKQELFNGKKFRNNNTQNIIETYYSNIESDLSKNKDFEIDVSFNKVSMRNMSPGMQAQALLKLLLNDELIQEGYNYVVFDQPEDNLDTPTISEVLVDRIKRLKKEIQIFVVSHSAPVIINGDARKVVMAKSDGFEISYSPDVINGKSAKEFISTVLDGGERFLKMRLYKYDFQVGENNDQSK